MNSTAVFVRAERQAPGQPAGVGPDGEGEVERGFRGVNGKGIESGSRLVRQPIVINQDE